MTKTLGMLGAFSLIAAWLCAQTPTKAVIVNSSAAKWTQDAPGSESLMLREDAGSGGMELMVRFPSGHTFKPHWHESNERILVMEGQLTLKQNDRDVHVDAGGYAFLPAREVQYLSCTSKGRCAFYLSWDGNPASKPAPVK